MNKLLDRQIRKYLGKVPQEEAFLKLLQAISDSYDHYDREHEIAARANEISSLELQKANERLIKDKNETAQAIAKLIESVQILQNNEQPFAAETQVNINLLSISEMIKTESQRRQWAEEQAQKNLVHLEKTNKNLDEFAYIVSHDLKAPLRAISNLAKWIEEDTKEISSPDVQNNLQLLQKRVERMENLINGILAYSKAGKESNESNILDLGVFINDIIDLIDPPSTFKVETKGNWPTILTDNIKLQQIFANLISNSVKYMDKEQGQIEIGCLPLENCIQCYVADNGPGIESKHHEDIFKLFKTITSKNEHESTGIGLSIVKKMIDEKGGKIWVDSSPQTGTKITFVWPTLIIKEPAKKQNYE